MPADLALDHQLCFALHAASRRITAAYRPLLDEVGLTYPQYVVLLALWEKDGITVRELGERLFLDSGTLSPLLVRLEGAGLITRARTDPDDGRRLTVTLTEAGWAMREQAERINCTLQENLPLPPEDALALRDLARRLLEADSPTDHSTEETP
ncbi:MAG: MarR family transcriptional regulator [Actinobacteria bacterium]|nr:MarR family transcriptional regulator [Actinomycetota bacterium]